MHLRRARWRGVIGGLVLVLAVPAAAADDPAALERQLQQTTGAGRVPVLLRLAQANLYRSPDDVVRYADEALVGARKAGLAREAARALLIRGTGHFQGGDLDKALASYRQGLEAGRALGDRVLIGGCLNGIAAVSLKQGRVEDALASFQEAAKHIEASGDVARLAGINNNISLIYYSKGKYDSALEYMFKALGLYEQSGDLNGQGVVLNAIGNVYNKLGKAAEARGHFERALAIAEGSRHTTLAVSALVNIAEIRIRAQEWQPALDALNRALAGARQLGNPDFVSVCLNNLGDVARARGRLPQALDYYQESMRIFEKMNARPRLVVSYLNIGRIHLELGERSEAETFLKKAFDLGGEVEERNLQREAAEVLLALYAERGDFERAFEYQKAVADLKEQVFSRENVEKIATLQAGYEAERKEREIALLRAERAIQVLEVKRQRLWLLLVASGSVLLLALAAVLFRRYRIKVRMNAELARAYDKVSELARLDGLTGLYNRRSAVERMSIEMARVGRTQRPFGVVLVDVDDFKKVNDVHGHEAGDRVLVALADLLRRTVREVDMVARWGGEEFLLVLPDTPLASAVAVAEKLRTAVAGLRVPYDGRELRVTATLGVSACGVVGPVGESIREADEALYEGKRAGKNRVVPVRAA